MRKTPSSSSAFSHTDGGRGVAGFREHNDCSVRAYAIAYGVTYYVAHAAFKRAGRRDRGRTKQFVSHAVMGAPTANPHALKSMPTFAAWLRENKSGRFVVHTRGHAFAVVDGVQHDLTGLFKPRARVQKFWRITGVTS